MLSQNAWFRWSEPMLLAEHPPGEPLARVLRDAVAARGWQAGEVGCWRDAGWCVTCKRGGAEVDLVLAEFGDHGAWGVQLAATYLPGLVGRLCKRAPSATDADLAALARDVHGCLVADPRVAGLRWRIDGDPSEAGTAAPEEVG